MGELTDDTPGLMVEQPAIFFVCRARHIFLLTMFVEHGAAGNYTWKQGGFQAIEPSGSNSDTAPIDTTTPTLISVMCNSHEHRTVLWLLRAKANVDNGCPIFFAARAGNVSVLEMLLKIGPHANAPWKRADVNAHCGPAGPAIIAAAQFGRQRACRCLVRSKADVNVALDDGSTAVYYAAQEGRCNTLQTLLELKANPNKTEHRHNVSPLYIAASQGHLNSVQVLLEHKADVNCQRDTGLTALECVKSKHDVDKRIVAVLLDAKADPNLKCGAGTPPVALGPEKT